MTKHCYPNRYAMPPRQVQNPKEEEFAMAEDLAYEKSWHVQDGSQIRETENVIKNMEMESRMLSESFEDRLQFEKLLSEISFTYSSLPTEKIDKIIESGLQRIGEFLGADRCSLVLFSQTDNIANIIYGTGNLDKRLVGNRTYFPWALDELMHGEVVQFTRIDELPNEANVDREAFTKFKVKSHISIPIKVEGSIMGAISFTNVRSHQSWHADLSQRLRIVGEIFANAMVRRQKELDIQRAFIEISELKNQLEADCTYLRQELELEHNFHGMLGQSDIFKHLVNQINQIAFINTTILILGETGTGKELVARAIHGASRRKDRPMVKVNCAALPSTLIESELFGHEKGAFTSAQAKQIGRFEQANGSTLFLDEIGELPLESQSKLLRVLQEGEFERLGSSRTTKTDVRIIAATNRNLEEEVRKGRFRQDLWYRLNVFPITVPPLRRRRIDIPLLATWFVEKFNRELGKRIQRIPKEVMDSLQNYTWPGNIRELENIIERAAITTSGTSLQLIDNLVTSPSWIVTEAEDSTAGTSDCDHILQVLKETKWRISGPKGAAAILGLNPSTLRYRMKKLGL